MPGCGDAVRAGALANRRKGVDALIVPSLLSADFSRLEESLRAVERAGVDMVTLDVMDGHFVPNLTFGPIIVSAVRKLTHLLVETHLMIEEPIRYVGEFAGAGADYITVHCEAVSDLGATLQAARDAGAKVGVAVKPETDLARIEAVLDRVDLVLVMTVDPGFGGQPFLEDMLPKIEQARNRREEAGLHYLVGVDGGINVRTAPLAAERGADLLVAGSAVFGGNNIEEAIRRLSAAVRAVRGGT